MAVMVEKQNRSRIYVAKRAAVGGKAIDCHKEKARGEGQEAKYGMCSAGSKCADKTCLSSILKPLETAALRSVSQIGMRAIY